MFSFNRLVIIWRGGICLKLDVQGQESEKSLDVNRQGSWGVLKIEQFPWRSYVYHPLHRLQNRTKKTQQAKKLACSLNT